MRNKLARSRQTLDFTLKNISKKNLTVFHEINALYFPSFISMNGKLMIQKKEFSLKKLTVCM